MDWYGYYVVQRQNSEVRAKTTGGIRVYVKQEEVVGVNPNHQATINNAMSQQNAENSQKPAEQFDPDISNAPNNGLNNVPTKNAPVDPIPF